MIQPRYETWEHDVSVEYDAEDKERDPYSSPLVVREVAYSGKRAIGPDTSSFRPSKMQSVPTVRMLMRQEDRAPIPTEEKIPLAPPIPAPLSPEVSRVTQEYPVCEYGPDAPAYTLKAFRAEHFQLQVQGLFHPSYMRPELRGGEDDPGSSA